MANLTLSDLETRLLRAERELEVTRAQLRALEAQAHRRSRLPRDGVLGLLALVLVAATIFARDIGAQGTRPQGQTVQAPFRVMNAAGKALLTVGSVDSVGQVIVGDAAAGHVTLGVGTSGSGYVIVARPDGNDGIALGQYKGRSMSIGIFGDKQTELVSLRTDQPGGGGGVRVMTAGGAPVGALMANATGGAIALTGPAGGNSAVTMGVVPTGGNLKLYPAAGGKAQVDLTADTTGGALTVYSTSGSPAGVLMSAKSGKGYLELDDAGGAKMVEAGTLDSHKGYVLVTPWSPSVDVHGNPSVLMGGGK